MVSYSDWLAILISQDFINFIEFQFKMKWIRLALSRRFGRSHRSNFLQELKKFLSFINNSFLMAWRQGSAWRQGMGWGREWDEGGNGMREGMGWGREWDEAGNGMREGMGWGREWDEAGNGMRQRMGWGREWDEARNGMRQGMGCTWFVDLLIA